MMLYLENPDIGLYNQSPAFEMSLPTILEKTYSVYNNRVWLFSDPLQKVYQVDGRANREITGFVAAMCAYGRVNQICASLDNLMQRTGPLYGYVRSASLRTMKKHLDSWKHRFATGADMASLLGSMAQLIGEHGSLEAAFTSGMSSTDATVFPALCSFYKKLSRRAGFQNNHLVPDPEKKSACKRYHLFLRWMVRKDNIDPGIWSTVPASKLMVPLDVHMHRVCRQLGFTVRRQADLRTVFEVTAAFKKLNPDDPVKYDFSLTRVGILHNIPAVKSSDSECTPGIV